MPLPIPIERLRQAIRSWPFSLADLPADCWLVGGAVRDLLINRQSSKPDLDFIVFEPALAVAQRFARAQGGSYVPLDPQRQIARVVLPTLTVDFARCEGDRLEADLQRRDYTINAIAWQPQQERLCDPCGGLADLQPGQLRMVSPTNLADDPLRLLRAFRQSSQLGFPIETETLRAIATLAPRIREVAAERVLAELQQLLHQDHPWPSLEQAIAHAVLQPWFPAATLPRIQALARAEAHLIAAVPALSGILTPLLPQSPWSLLALTRFTALLDPEPIAAETRLQTLKVSRALARQTLTLLQCQSHLPAARQGNLEARFRLYRQSRELLPGCLLIGDYGVDLIPLLQAWLDSTDRVAHPRAWVDGRQLMQALDLAPGPQIGDLLEAIALATARGEIDSVEAAIALARQQLTKRLG